MNSTRSIHHDTSEEPKTTERATPTPQTPDGEPLPLREKFTTGSKSWGDVQKDKHQWAFNPSFPGTSTARTTFYAREAPPESSKPWDQFWRLQHGRGHTYEDWNGQRVRPADRFNYRRACIILSRANVGGVHRKEALRRVMQEDLNGFNVYYAGVWGAALGFAAYSRFKSPDDAKASYIVDVADEVLNIDGTALIDYVWRTSEGDGQ